jgi:trehalose 6-phosphate phosphatase
MTLQEETELFASLPRLLLCTDFDGTLTPIQPDPDAVQLSEPARQLLLNLSRLPGTTLAIVSGRSMQDVRQRIGLPDLWYVGNHGLEIVGPDATYLHPDLDQLRPTLESWLRLLHQELSSITGLFIEDKQYTVSVHYRSVKDQKMLNEVERTVKQSCPASFEIRHGKMVWELRPKVDWHKGRGIAWLIERFQAPVAFLGDDETDEDAFTFLGTAALTIKVGDTPTAARYRLSNVSAATSWLTQLYQERLKSFQQK